MRMIDSFANFTTGRPRAIVVGVIILTVLACIGTINLKIITDYRYFFDEDSPDKLAFAAMEEEFGGTDNVMLAYAPKSGNVLTPENILRIAALADALADIPYADKIDSLADISVAIPGTAGPTITTLRHQAEADEFDEDLWQRTLAEVRRFADGMLLASDNSMAAANVMLSLPDDNDFWVTRSVQKFAKQVRADFENQYPGDRILLAGVLPYYHDITELAMRDIYALFPICILIATLLLRGLLGSWRAAGACGLPVFCAVLTTVGLNNWFSLPTALPTMIVPIIVLVIALAYSIHYADTYLQIRGDMENSQSAAKQSFRENLEPAILTSATTVLGFLMMNTSISPPYRNMGNVAAIGVAVSVLYTVTLMPAMLTLVDPPYWRKKGLLRTTLEAIGERFSKPIRSFWVLSLGFAVILALLASISLNTIDDNINQWFDKDTRMRQDNEEVNKTLNGLQHLYFRLPAESPALVHDPEYLNTVKSFEDWLIKQPHVDAVRSLPTLVSNLNLTFGSGTRSIPDDPKQTEQLLWVYEFSARPDDRAAGLLNADRSASLIHIARHNQPGQDFQAFAAEAHQWIKTNAPNMEVDPGKSGVMMFSKMALENIPPLIMGTLVVLLFATIVVAIALKSIRLGLISIVPNLLPVGLAFGTWGLFSGHVGIALSVISTAALGIIVDDTIHLLERYKEGRKGGAATPGEACRHAIRRVGGAITITTMVLVVGIGLIGFSQVQPTHELGLWLAITIAYAWLCDLLILPQLLTRFDR